MENNLHHQQKQSPGDILQKTCYGKFLYIYICKISIYIYIYIYIKYIFLKCKTSNCSKDKPDQLNRSFVYETDEVFIFSTSDDTEDDILWLSSVSD